MQKQKLHFITHLTLVLVCIISIGYLLHIGRSILAPFFLAFLLALLFLPFVRFLERKLKFPKLLSSFTCILVILLLIGGISTLFGTQFSNFGEDIPKLQGQLESVFTGIREQIDHNFHVNAHDQFIYLRKGLDKLLSSSGTVMAGTVSVFSSVFGFLFFCIIFLFFILGYRTLLGAFIIDIFPAEHEQKVRQAIEEVKDLSKSYLIGICIQIVIVSALASIVLSIFGVKYAIIIGIFTGLFNVIPYVGIALSALIACLFALITVSPVTVLYVLIGYLIIHVIDGNVILPFVVGAKVNINPLFSFLGILIGASLWGITGMFLCIPALAIFKIICHKVDALKPWGRVLGDVEG